jgi:NAD(P)-dependent dehydrogenase (short-subunit alcohol dehydrogenase family)
VSISSPDAFARFSLDGRVAVVTGGGGGIGRAYARALAEAGASVVVTDIAEPSIKTVADELVAEGMSALAIPADVTDEASIVAMTEETARAFGRIDILVNNAAMMVEISADDLLTIPLERWERALRVNVTGPVLCTRAVVPHMREHGYGKIINQSSGGAFMASGPYGATKLALVSITVSLANQLARDGIRVNAIAPGATNTEAGNRSMPDDARTFMEMTVPFPWGEPEDLVGALLWLASPAGDWVTGQCINVDGGWITRL